MLSGSHTAFAVIATAFALARSLLLSARSNVGFLAGRTAILLVAGNFATTVWMGAFGFFGYVHGNSPV